MKIELFSILLILPSIFALFGSGDGLILYTSDKGSRSGVLSANHRCAEFPNSFKAAYVQNTGSSHCAMWTDDGCKGNLYVVPAHYTMRVPSEKFKSVIC